MTAAWEAWAVTYRGTLISVTPTVEGAREAVFERFDNIKLTVDDTFWNDARTVCLLIVKDESQCPHAFVLSKQTSDIGTNIPQFASDLLR